MKREPFQNFTGIAAPLPRKDINTDAIIPAPYLRTADADLAHGLFALWRYDEHGKDNPGFILNRPGFAGAQILLADENFGCGSSREAAAWALQRYGIKAVFAPSFADIFYENAFRNGILPGLVSSQSLKKMLETIGDDPQRAAMAIDLASGTMTDSAGGVHRFTVPDFRRDALLRGDDEIAATLRCADDIDVFMKHDEIKRPWIYGIGLTP